MTLGELASKMPGYVVLLFHTENKSWHMPAGAVINREELTNAMIVQVTPIAPYTMEISIEFKEEHK